MSRTILYALLLTAAPTAAFAQQIGPINSSSGSNSTANSGSQSGADASNSSNNNIGNAANNNIGTSTSTSGSEANANSGSVSGSTSNGNQQGQGQDQGQGQSQGANNTQGQGQDQSANNTQGQGQDQNQSQGQEATQANGQTTSLTFNNSAPKHVQVRTNTPVGLAASSSFSSDYCGGTVSGGASVAPLGISLGGAAPRYDKSCQALRRAEKFGMAAANAVNMGQPMLAQQLMSMMIWSICTSDSGGPSVGYPTALACQASGLLGSTPTRMSEAATPSPRPQPARTARVRDENGKVTVEAASRASDQSKETLKDVRIVAR